MRARKNWAARLGIRVAMALCLLVSLAGCGTGGSGATGAGPTADAQSPDGLVSETTGATSSSTATPVATADRAEIERRLALPRFTYVAESEGQGTAKPFGALAFIDSETDTLAFRPHIGSDLGRVAVAPDGRLIYVTDEDEPVVWVVDA
ncbi:MAG: hypothetical protein NTW58_02440 [Actinobacteria bacterium]|nr:hypothetical protein [Actinomycetota bacterium]